MNYYSITDIGKIRDGNEDNYSNYIGTDFSLFVVADGMGGHSAGEVASKIAVESIREYIRENKNEKDIENLLISAMKNADFKIKEHAKIDLNSKDMGTTAVAAILNQQVCYVANVGDSRLYLFRDGDLRQITKDHSYVQELIDSGYITQEEAKTFPNKNYITNALGGIQKDVLVSTYRFELKDKDKILLATDGLTSMVEDEEIVDLLNLDLDLKESSEILIYMANSMGGYDNITLTLIQYEGQ